MNLAQIEEARLLATPIAQNFTADDTCPAIIIQHVPSLGTGGTSASFTLANDSLQFLVDSASPAGKDLIGTTGKIGLTTTYNTMGLLADYINGFIAWRAILLGCLRSMTAVGLLDKASVVCSNANGAKIFIDTTDYDEHYFCISGERFVDNGVYGHIKDADDEVVNYLMYGSFLVSGDSDDLSLTYYSGKQGVAETTIRAAESLTLGTATEHGEENNTMPFVEAKRGERLVIGITTASDAIGTPTVDIVGKSVVFNNSRIVTAASQADTN